MRTITEKVMDKLSGVTEEQLGRRKNIRKLLWYERWKTFSKDVESGDKKKIMESAFLLVESCKGHGHVFVAKASREAMELVSEEMEGNK